MSNPRLRHHPPDVKRNAGRNLYMPEIVHASTDGMHLQVILCACLHFDGDYVALFDNLTVRQGNGSGGLESLLESSHCLPNRWSAGASVAAAVSVEVKQPRWAVVNAGIGISRFQRLYDLVPWRGNFDPCSWA